MSVSQAIRNPRGYIVRTAGMYRALLFDPERFYDEYLGSRGLKVEIALVAFIGVVGFIGNYYARSRITTVYPEVGEPIGNDVNFNLWGNTVEPLVGIFLLWVGLTAAVFILSWLYTTVGNFYELLKHLAWSMVPVFVYNLLHTAALAYSAFQFQESDAADIAVPQFPSGATTVMWNSVAAEVYVVATVVVGAIAFLWAGYIALYAVLDVRKLERRDAYKVVGVPYVAFALYLLYNAFTMFTWSPP